MAQAEGRIAHASLICAPTGEQALQKARELAAAAVCSGAGKKPCGVCRDCRKVEANVHPDVTTLSRLADDKGKQKQFITVDQIRALSADAVVLPNEAARKVYIIEQAETMNPAAQNAALKLLEEPPAGAVFLLCTTRPMQLLETVRSRCALVKLTGEDAGSADGGSGGACAGLSQGGQHQGPRPDPSLVRPERKPGDPGDERLSGGAARACDRYALRTGKARAAQPRAR